MMLETESLSGLDPERIPPRGVVMILVGRWMDGDEVTFGVIPVTVVPSLKLPLDCSLLGFLVRTWSPNTVYFLMVDATETRR